jgi:hypothetical protein
MGGRRESVGGSKGDSVAGDEEQQPPTPLYKDRAPNYGDPAYWERRCEVQSGCCSTRIRMPQLRPLHSACDQKLAKLHVARPGASHCANQSSELYVSGCAALAPPADGEDRLEKGKEYSYDWYLPPNRGITSHTHVCL